MGEEGEGRLLEWDVLSGAYGMLKHWYLRVIVFVALCETHTHTHTHTHTRPVVSTFKISCNHCRLSVMPTDQVFKLVPGTSPEECVYLIGETFKL